MFQYFPKVLYKINDYDYQKVVDINVSAQITDYIKNFKGAAGIRKYNVRNGERPEIVSNLIYGTTRYDYILLLMNDIESIYDDWPKSSDALNKYVVAKYGSMGNASVIAHWFNSYGDEMSEAFWNDLSDSGKYTQTHYEYEVAINDKKSQIKILDIQYIVKFESGLQELFDTLYNTNTVV